MGPNCCVSSLTPGGYFKLQFLRFLGTMMFLLLFLLLPLVHGAGSSGIHQNLTDWFGAFLWIQDPRGLPGPTGPVLYGW